MYHGCRLAYPDDDRGFVGPLSINSIIVKSPLLILLQVPILSPEFDHFPIRKLKAFVLTQILSGGLDFISFFIYISVRKELV